MSKWYCREWVFVAGIHDFSHFIMRELCGFFVSTVFTPNREHTLSVHFVQQYRTFENYYAGCRWIAIHWNGRAVSNHLQSNILRVTLFCKTLVIGRRTHHNCLKTGGLERRYLNYAVTDHTNDLRTAGRAAIWCRSYAGVMRELCGIDEPRVLQESRRIFMNASEPMGILWGFIQMIP